MMSRSPDICDRTVRLLDGLSLRATPDNSDGINPLHHYPTGANTTSMPDTQSAHGFDLTSLPPELIAVVASHMPKSSLAGLMRANKFFYNLCLKILYAEVDEHIITWWSDEGVVHRRPSLRMRVRCLQVLARPETCCALRPFTLPNLEVLRLEFGGQFETRRGGVPEFASTNAYHPRTIVVELPHDVFYSGFPMAYLSSKMKTAQLVFLLRNFHYADGAVSNFTPRGARSVTILILFNRGQCTLNRVVSALVSICLRLANQDCTPFQYHRLQHVRFVVGGMQLSQACYDQLLRSLLKHIKRHSYYKGRDMPTQYAESETATTTGEDAPWLPDGPSADDTPYDPADRSQRPPPTIEIVPMDDYLARKSSRFVLSRDDLKLHYKLARENVISGAEAVAEIRRHIERYSHRGLIMKADLDLEELPDWRAV